MGSRAQVGHLKRSVVKTGISGIAACI